MNDHGITKENLLFAFPDSLKQSETMSALADITAELLAKRPQEIAQLALYTRIHELPEDLLDILAYDFKVDWWDPNYTLEEKRRTLADSWRVHKMLGTKAAVETAIRAIYPKTDVVEWFEYGGKPYYFKLLIDMTDEDPDPARRDRALSRVNFYKNLRSHVDSIEYTINMDPVTLYIGGAVSPDAYLQVPVEPDAYLTQATVHVGGCAAPDVILEIPQKPDIYESQDTVRFGGTLSPYVNLEVPVERDAFEAHSTVRLGGSGGQEATLPFAPSQDEFTFQRNFNMSGRGCIETSLPVMVCE